MLINKLKNKFRQKEFGACVPTCLANIFDAPQIIATWEGGERTGLDYEETKSIVLYHTEDWETPQTLDKLLYSTKRIDKYIPLFDLDQEDLPKDTYMVFLAGVEESPRHCIAVIKQNGKDQLLVLDPNSDDPYILTKDRFFSHYNVYELEVLSSVKTKGVSFFPREFFNHLKYKK